MLPTPQYFLPSFAFAFLFTIADTSVTTLIKLSSFELNNNIYKP